MVGGVREGLLEGVGGSQGLLGGVSEGEERADRGLEIYLDFFWVLDRASNPSSFLFLPNREWYYY